MPTTLPGFLNSTEAAEYMGLSDSLVRRYCRAGKIKAHQVGRNWAIRKSECDRFLKQPRPVGNPTFRKSVSRN